jgi:FLVCR family feline leukemia virus subgroup C receptor-related protein
MDSDEFSDVDIKGLRVESSGGGQGAAENDPSEFDEDLDSFPYAYKKRWLILSVLSITIVINSFCLNLVGDFQTNIQLFYRRLLPEEIYDVYLGAGFFFSLHVFIDVIFVLLAMIVVELRGLRSTCLVAITLSCLGAWIRCATVGSKLYAVLFLGLVLCDIGQIYLTTALFYLSACWFAKNETAVSIAVYHRTHLFPLKNTFK